MPKPRHIGISIRHSFKAHKLVLIFTKNIKQVMGYSCVHLYAKKIIIVCHNFARITVLI